MTAKEFKKTRASLGYTQQQMAEALGVDRNTVNRWEMGIRRIPLMAEKLLTIIKTVPVSKS